MTVAIEQVYKELKDAPSITVYVLTTDNAWWPRFEVSVSFRGVLPESKEATTDLRPAYIEYKKVNRVQIHRRTLALIACRQSKVDKAVLVTMTRLFKSQAPCMMNTSKNEESEKS